MPPGTGRKCFTTTIIAMGVQKFKMWRSTTFWISVRGSRFVDSIKSRARGKFYWAVGSLDQNVHRIYKNNMAAMSVS